MSERDEITLTPEAKLGWQAVAIQAALILAALGVEDPVIPDEMAVANEDGSLTIFVEVGSLRFEMAVPPDHWSRVVR
jgi:hypothetical protein